MGKIIKQIILFLVGFCMYITLEVCFRGYSFPLMGICGGLAIVLLDKINNYISWDVDILIQGSIGAVLITGMELVIGILFKQNILPVMWDYTDMPLNYNGIICLPFSLIWLVVSILAIFIADAINYYVFTELPVPYYKLFGKVILRFREKE